MAGTETTEEAKRGAFPRAWQILEFVVGSVEPPSAQDVAQALGLALPTTMRLLAMLATEGLIDVDEENRRYLPGPALFRLLALGGQSGQFGALSRSPLEELAQTTGETACLNLLQPEDRFSVVAVEEGRHQLRYVIAQGGLHPLDRGAGGKAILAFLPDERRAEIVRGSGDPAGLEAQLAAIRANGFALSFGERVNGAVGFAAPIFRLDGRIRGSVQITIPEQRYSQGFEDSFKSPLTRAAGALSSPHASKEHDGV